MILRSAILSLLLSALCCTGAAADWLVLRGGKKIETTGEWVVRANLLTVQEATHRVQTLLLSIVDFEATLQANANRAGSPARRQAAADPRSRPIPADGHFTVIDTVAIKQIGAITRMQSDMAAQMRAREQAEMLAQAAGGKPARKGSESDGQGGDDPSQARRLGRPSNPGAGFQATENCKIWQDNPKLYSDCLAGH